MATSKASVIIYICLMPNSSACLRQFPIPVPVYISTYHARRQYIV